MRSLVALVTAILIAGALAGSVSAAATSGQTCETGAAGALRACIKSVATQTGKCYLGTGAACAADDTKVVKALAKLEGTVLKKCPNAAAVADAGYGALASPAALVARMHEACLGEPAQLAARTFGGPLATVLAGADAATRECLETAWSEATKLQKSSVAIQASCLKKAHKGGSCDVAKTTGKVSGFEAKAAPKIQAACPDLMLKATIGLDIARYIARASAQSRCTTATAHGDTAPLSLDCGPRPSVPVPPRGTWVQVVLDEATWGTRCGKGGQYAFWLRLAPNGSPLDRVVTDMQGGGVCIDQTQCAGTPANLFTATDEGQPTGGYLNTNPAVNPFSDWTMLFMPYCTQDVHIGGGLSSVFSESLTVHRFGAINVRAALNYLRDVLWAAMEAEDPDGWNPEQLTVFFAGESAGAFGVQYNYHYALDDLRWPNTMAVPDSGLALDNGGIGVAVLGTLITTETNPLGWGTRPYQPPYCLGSTCAVGPVLQTATVPRLQGPYQRFLNLSNQVDNTQISTTLFTSAASFINVLRTDYCARKDVPRTHFFYPASSTPIHTMLRSNSLYQTLTAGGVTLRDWLADAFDDPTGVESEADEGTLVADYPGVNPIACAGSPSGAFLE